VSILVLRFCALKLIFKLICGLLTVRPLANVYKNYRRENRKYASSHTTVVRIASVKQKCSFFLRHTHIYTCICVYQVRTGFLNSSYKTAPKGHDDALTVDELVKLVQPSDLLHLTHQHNRRDCIVLWIEYASHFYHMTLRYASAVCYSSSVILSVFVFVTLIIFRITVFRGPQNFDPSYVVYISNLCKTLKRVVDLSLTFDHLQQCINIIR